MLPRINQAIYKLVKRAEKYDNQHLINTFVDVGPLFTLLQNPDHQIIYGRRGTGKTHALIYLKSQLDKKGYLTVYIDMRNVGSNGGIYSDFSLSITERATRLLIDTFSLIHDQILEFILFFEDKYDLSKFGPILDELAKSISEIEVVGNIEIEETDNLIINDKNESTGAASLTELSISRKDEVSTSTGNLKRKKIQGQTRHRVHFTTINSIFTRLKMLLGDKELWVLIDEWAEIPLDLQPLLADLFRRTLFSIKGITVKIAAIEKRTNFKQLNSVNYIGIETGADISASLNLDEFVVFDNDPAKSKEFFKTLLYNHVNQYLIDDGNGIPNKETFIKYTFTQIGAFDELVRASEGITRDAINILIHSAIKAGNEKISISNIRSAARSWFISDKEKSVIAKPEAKILLRWIIDEIIGNRKVKAFLLSSDKQDEVIEYLFDNRIIHLIKQNISSKDNPGERFNVFAIDYGAYVHLINTTEEPKGLFMAETEYGENYIEVPINDYRSIRRSILNLDDFYKKNERRIIGGRTG